MDLSIAKNGKAIQWSNQIINNFSIAAIFGNNYFLPGILGLPNPSI